MKHLLTILITVLAFSCQKKDQIAIEDVKFSNAPADPTVSNVSFYKRSIDGAPHVAFAISVEIQEGAAVAQMNVVFDLMESVRATISSPKTGQYFLVDMESAGYPTAASGAYYHIEMIMQDGRVIKFAKFKVY